MRQGSASNWTVFSATGSSGHLLPGMLLSSERSTWTALLFIVLCLLGAASQEPRASGRRTVSRSHLLIGPSRSAEPDPRHLILMKKLSNAEICLFVIGVMYDSSSSRILQFNLRHNELEKLERWIFSARMLEIGELVTSAS